MRTVILVEGTNDLWDSQQNHNCGTATTPPLTAPQLISAYQVLIRAAHARGIRVIGATILPFKASYEPPADFARAEAIRQAVNHWILTSGRYDAVADFAAAVADPTDPQQLNPAYNSGDSLHPNDAGYQAIAAAIDIDNLSHPRQTGRPQKLCCRPSRTAPPMTRACSARITPPRQPRWSQPGTVARPQPRTQHQTVCRRPRRQIGAERESSDDQRV